MLQNLLIITIIFGILHSEHSVIRPSSKVSVKVQDILTRQDAGSGRSSIARVIVPGVGVRPELPQSNPPSNTNLNNFMRSFQNYDLERSNNDTLRPSSDYWTLKRLRRILRKDFDPEWMSIAQPSLESLPYGYPKPNLDLIKSVDQLDFNMTNIYPGPIQPEHVALFKNWLISKSSCQIKFIWDNLGDLFWPKFIRRGVCQNSAGSCSWPPGMGCKLGGGKTLKILRWKCDNQVPEEPLRRLYRRDNRQVGPWSPDFRRLKRQNISSQKRRENRLRRLIRQLSVTKNGLHCRWTHYEHVISDECICGCN